MKKPEDTVKTKGGYVRIVIPSSALERPPVMRAVKALIWALGSGQAKTEVRG